MWNTDGKANKKGCVMRPATAVCLELDPAQDSEKWGKTHPSKLPRLHDDGAAAFIP